MNSMRILGIVLLVTVAFNFAHWGFHRGKRLHYSPKSGWLRFLFTALEAAMLISLVATLLTSLPSSVLVLTTVMFVAPRELYSIWVRRTQISQGV